jgi:hypothetical protein
MDRPDKLVDALAASRVIRPLWPTGDEARVVNQKIHVREHLGDNPDVARQAVFVRPLAEREAFVDADVLDPERAGLLDHAQARTFVIQKEATSIRPPLSITLPGRYPTEEERCAIWQRALHDQKGIHAATYGTFYHQRHLLKRPMLKELRTTSFDAWQAASVAA